MTIKLIVKQKLNANDIINTFHYGVDPASSGMTPDEMAQAVAQAYADHLATLWSTEWSLVGIDWVDPDAGGGQPSVPANVPILPITGDTLPQAQANQVACLINWIAPTQAPFRGKTYLGGMYDAAISVGGVWESGLVDAVNAFATDLLGITNGSGGFASLVIRSGGTPTVPAGQISLVQDGVCNPVPATQRRRRLTVGS